jgi:hypothetical protein
MLQGTSERLLRAAESFRWSGDKLRIVRAVLDEHQHPQDVANHEKLSRKRVDNLVSEARRELYAKAVCECEPEAFEVDTRIESDPLTPDEHAFALCYATGYENEFPDCKTAVLAVGAY